MQLMAKRHFVLLVVWLNAAFFMANASWTYGAGNEHESSSNHTNASHSDALLILLRHKVALQKLQEIDSSHEYEQVLRAQAKHLKQVMPILKDYMSTPKSYYLTTQMYHESLENRAAMLADFSEILVRYQKQLVSKP